MAQRYRFLPRICNGPRCTTVFQPRDIADRFCSPTCRRATPEPEVEPEPEPAQPARPVARPAPFESNRKVSNRTATPSEGGLPPQESHPLPEPPQRAPDERIRASDADDEDRPYRWTNDAACRDLDTAFFFPERGAATAPIKAVCHACPVETECLEFALDTSQMFGIWGGKSERERRRLRRGRGRTRQAS